MKKQLGSLLEFHDKFNVNIEHNPTIPQKDRRKLRQSLLEEELREFKEAWKKDDIVGVADALVDLQYVLLGTVVEFGLASKFEELFDEVHKSNMTKLKKNGKPRYRKDGKVIKSKEFIEPNLKKILGI